MLLCIVKGTHREVDGIGGYPGCGADVQMLESLENNLKIRADLLERNDENSKSIKSLGDEATALGKSTASLREECANKVSVLETEKVVLRRKMEQACEILSDDMF